MKLIPRLALPPLFLSLLSLGTYAQGPVTVYQAQGVLTEFDHHSNQATLICNAIPGYMAASTRQFSVHDIADFNKLLPGDIVSFQLSVSGDVIWVEQAAKIGTNPNAVEIIMAPKEEKEFAERATTSQPVVVAAHQLQPGDRAPDVELIDQSGHKVHLSDYKGNAVAVTFIFTGCTMPTYCPMVNQNFAHTQDLMAKLGAGDHWHLLSISMDPAHDTPVALATFASAMHADQSHWTLATADESKVRTFGGAFGLEFQHTGKTITHNLCTAVIDPSGNIYSIYHGNSWTPQQVASDLSASMRHAVRGVLLGAR